jgi:threonine aldolase
MRQAGVLAAAGLVALDEGRARLHQDHETARALRDGLQSLEGVEIRWAATNMVFLRVPAEQAARVHAALAHAGVVVDGSGQTMRLVTHRGIDLGDIEVTVEAFRRGLASHRVPAAAESTGSAAMDRGARR